MKILFFVNSFPKLSETFILNQITGLIDRGNNVYILACKSENVDKIHASVKKYDLLKKTFYYYEEENGKFKRVYNFINKLILHYLNKIFNPKYNGKIKLRQIIENHALLYLSLLCNKRKMNYDVVIAHFGPNGLLAQKLINANLINGELFTVFHGYDMLELIKKNGRDMYLPLFRSKSILLPISIFWKKKLIRLGADPRCVIVHHMGIDMNQFFFSPKQISNSKSKVKIVSVARFVEKKGLKYGIDAVAELRKNGYNIQYTIIGGGPLEIELKREVENKNLSNCVSFESWKTQSEIIDFIKDAHFVILPSVRSTSGDMEGIPVILMEAMAMGKIVISTYHSGIPELIDNGKSGFLVPEKNSIELTKVISNLIEQNKSWSDLEFHAREKVKNEFNIRYLNEELIKIFTTCIEKSKDVS